MSPPSRFGANRWITPVALLLLFASHVYLLRDVYLTHRFMITHDSVANFAPYQFAFTGLHTGVLPLWSPEMNAGEPLWPVVELHPAYDPVVLAVFAIATQVGATGITAFSIVLLFWLLGFALGGWLLARIIGLSPVSRVFVFIVLLWSSVSILMLYQSQYVVIARWVPLALAAGWWFLRQPSVSRAALFGVVLGLALPGYQTPYLVLFAVVLAAAGGHETLTLLRGTPRLALGVAALFALAILLPTLTAAAEWLGMTPVARLAWPRGTRAVLTFDVLLPLLGELRTESALYVGVVPPLLALVAATAALARPDRRARFWTWTTAGTMLIFLGAPEMITGRDQPFLFVRDWSFVLPLVVLCVAMLGGIGLDYVRARLSARWAVPVAIALTALAGLDLSSFAHAHYRRVAVPRTPEFQAREPGPVRPVVGFSAFRRREFEIAAYAPFHKQGPAVWGIPSAYLDPEPFIPPYRPLGALGQLYTHGSHYFRLPRYDVVLGALPRSSFDCIAGVTCPIARLVGPGIAAPDFTAALFTLKQTSVERLRDTIVVEDPLNDAVPGPADPAGASGPGDPIGTFTVRRYHASSVEFDVVMRRRGFLYYADGYTPDWTATVDGRPARIVAANGAFKAVFVAAGSHRVTMEYRPWRYILAFPVRVLAIFVGLGLFLSTRHRELPRELEAVESSRPPC